jgi:integrase
VAAGARGGEDAGLEGWARFSGHSLRAGLATAAGEAGADLAQVMRQIRHRSAEVAMGYLRPAEIWRQNPTETIWSDAVAVLQQIPAWIDDYNENHPHKGLRMRSPREFIRAQFQPDSCPV